MVAGVPGLEPGPKVLETSMLTIDTIPLRRFFDFSFWRLCIPGNAPENPDERITKIENRLFVFAMHSVRTTATAELLEFEPIRRRLLVLGRHVVAFFALCALQNDVIPWHKTMSSLTTR